MNHFMRWSITEHFSIIQSWHLLAFLFSFQFLKLRTSSYLVVPQWSTESIYGE